MKLHLLGLALLLSVGVGSAHAQNSAGQGNQNQTPQAAASSEARSTAETEAAAEELSRGEEVICRRERVTGSLTRSNRICMTRNEWNGVAESTREVTSDLLPRVPGNGACQQGVAGC